LDCLDEPAGYMGLLEAGVRIFEWQGPMLHAKTTVVDGMWCRVGSSNLNLASLLTNWELDVVVEDEALAAPPSRCFCAICRPVEKFISAREPLGQGGSEPAKPRELDPRHWNHLPPNPSSPPPPVLVGGRAGAAVVRASAAVLGVALRRRYERSAWSVSIVAALLLLSLGGLGFFQPQILGLGHRGSVYLVWTGFVDRGYLRLATQRTPQGTPPTTRNNGG
jgi:cardiolipin synthase